MTGIQESPTDDCSSYRIFYDEIAASETVKILRGCFGSKYRLIALEEDDHSREVAEGSVADFILAGWRPISKDILLQSTRLRAIHKMGAGVDKIPVDLATQCGVSVTVSAGLNAAQVAEHTIMLMLSVLRCLTESDSSIRRGSWLKNELRPKLRSLSAQTVGIIGFGSVGRAVAERLLPFGCKLVYCDAVRVKESLERELQVSYMGFESLLKCSSVITLHVPLTAETRHLIGGRELSLIKPDTVLINTSRGEVVDQLAVLQELVDGNLAGAGLDVFATEPPDISDPLFSLPTVTLSPHVAGSSKENIESMGDQARTVFDAILAGRKPVGLIN